MKVMVQKVQAYMEQYHMMEQGDCIILGVSGGADSMCLLVVLQELMEAYGLEIHVVHVNHQLRVEAEGEAKYVESYCKRHKIPYHYVICSVMEYADEHCVSYEEAGRILRYEAFQKVYDNLNVSRPCKIAVAHHQNDRAETMLFHMARGTDVTGLQGIPPVRDAIIRPLLCVTRVEIEAYLQEHKIAYCTDESNFGDDYTRNQIRNHVIPRLEMLNSECIHHMNHVAVVLEELEDFVLEQVKQARRHCVVEDKGKYKIRSTDFKAYHIVVQRKLVHLLLSTCMGCSRDLTATHVASVLALLEKQSGKYCMLPRGMIARKEYEYIIIEKAKYQNQREQTEVYYIDAFPATVSSSTLGTITFTKRERKEITNIEEKRYTKWFDYDKIKSQLSLRGKQTGDYIALNSTSSTQSLSRYFIKAKVPRQMREQYLLLADGSHIVWILGERISEAYKVTEETKYLLEVTLDRIAQEKKG